MPSPSPEEPRRRRRRAVRQAGIVGDDETILRSSFPAPAPEDAARPPRPVVDGAEPGRGAPFGAEPGAGALPGALPGAAASGAGLRVVRRAPDDEDVGWGPPVADSNDDRLARDRPPHW